MSLFNRSLGERVMDTMSNHPVATLGVGVVIGIAGTLATQSWIMPMFQQPAQQQTQQQPVQQQTQQQQPVQQQNQNS